MSKVPYPCCVKGCGAKGVISHRFPNPRIHTVRLREWMKVVGFENECPQLIYQNKRICAAHFTDDCLSPGTKRLNCRAFPTVNMPAG